MITSTTTKNKNSTLLIYPSEPLEIDFGDLLKPMNGDDFFYFCQRHKDLRIEMDQFGEITIMSPTGSETGGINFELSVDFGVWVRTDGTGKGFDSSTGFILPNGAKRSPDLSWIKLEKWLAIPAEKRKKFAPICPDFVVEIRSESDSLTKLQGKMAEYIENGSTLGWLLDVNDKKVYIYQQNVPIQILDNPSEISGEPLLKGFNLQMKGILG
ncbi:Uma2 family endonuclease [Methylovulum psychrotolerans]|jgi:Uma2 family endonuclease|uniref:Uma2 family endonuclease n=2 Tax=Methylovulum psychrotolerans TaxID=1704499 RepID=A0A2S5CHA1_9GAMM|nr:Uma2 family endonuclease [Methylovulum psychrotolerans]POZ50169.1 Uma2 family endonuclease [Methylovulum psychrotolerans]